VDDEIVKIKLKTKKKYSSTCRRKTAAVEKYISEIYFAGNSCIHNITKALHKYLSSRSVNMVKIVSFETKNP